MTWTENQTAKSKQNPKDTMQIGIYENIFANYKDIFCDNQ